VLLNLFSIVGVALAVVLAFVLYFLRRRRWRTEWDRKEARWNGAVFDARLVSPRVSSLRQNYGAGAALRPEITSGRKASLASARRTLARLGCFARAASGTVVSTNLETPPQ